METGEKRRGNKANLQGQGFSESKIGRKRERGKGLK